MDLGSKGSGLGSNENKREDELKAREEGCRGDIKIQELVRPLYTQFF